MKSDAIKLGPVKAAQRSLLKAIGLTEEEIEMQEALHAEEQSKLIEE